MFRLRFDAPPPTSFKAGQALPVELRLCTERGFWLPPPAAPGKQRKGSGEGFLALRCTAVNPTTLQPSEHWVARCCTQRSASGGGSGGGSERKKKDSAGGGDSGRVSLRSGKTEQMAVSLSRRPGGLTADHVGVSLMFETLLDVTADGLPAGAPSNRSSGSSTTPRGDPLLHQVDISAIGPQMFVAKERGGHTTSELAPGAAAAQPSPLVIVRSLYSLPGLGQRCLVCVEGCQLLDSDLPGLGSCIWDSTVLLSLLLDELHSPRPPSASKQKGNGGSIGSLTAATAASSQHAGFSSAALRGKRVLELGAGCGLAGITAALLGADVLLTDREPTLSLVTRHAVAANEARVHARGKGAGGGKSKKAPKAPVTAAAARKGKGSGGGGNSGSSSSSSGGGVLPAGIRCAELSWGDDDQDTAGSSQAVDLILGSDIVFDEELFAPLVKTLLSKSRPPLPPPPLPPPPQHDRQQQQKRQQKPPRSGSGVGGGAPSAGSGGTEVLLSMRRRDRCARHGCDLSIFFDMMRQHFDVFELLPADPLAASPARSGTNNDDGDDDGSFGVDGISLIKGGLPPKCAAFAQRSACVTPGKAPQRLGIFRAVRVR